MKSLLRQLISAFAAPVAAFLAGPLLARALGPDGRGDLATATSAVILVVTIAAAGFPEAFAISAAQQGASPRRFLGRHVRSVLLLCAAAAVTSLIVGTFVFRSRPSAASIMVIGAFVAPVLVLVEIVRGGRLGAQQLGYLQAESYVNNFGRLAVLGLLALLGVLTTVSAGLATLGAMVVGGSILFIPRRRGNDLVGSLPGAGSEIGKTERRTANRVWFGSIATQANIRADQVVMIALTSAAQIGYYAVAVSIAQLISLAIYAVRSFAFKALAADRSGAIAARSIRTILPFTLIAVAAFEISAQLIVLTLFGNDFAPAIPALRVLLLGSVPLFISGVCSVVLNSSGMATLNSIGQWISLALGIGTLTWLAPSWGAVGASFASVVSYTAAAAWGLYWMRRLFHQRWSDLFILNMHDVRWIADQFRGRR